MSTQQSQRNNKMQRITDLDENLKNCTIVLYKKDVFILDEKDEEEDDEMDIEGEDYPECQEDEPHYLDVDDTPNTDYFHARVPPCFKGTIREHVHEWTDIKEAFLKANEST